MSMAFNEPSNTEVAILFDRMVISLQGADQYKMAGFIGLAGHFPIVLPDEFPLAGYMLIARGVVIKSPNANALLTVTIGANAVTQEWPVTGKVIEVGGRKSEPAEPALDIQTMNFDLCCFTGDQHLAIGQPPKFPPAPPLTLSVCMQARRRSVEDVADIHLDSLDIAMLRQS